MSTSTPYLLFNLQECLFFVNIMNTRRVRFYPLRRHEFVSCNHTLFPRAFFDIDITVPLTYEANGLCHRDAPVLFLTLPHAFLTFELVSMLNILIHHEGPVTGPCIKCLKRFEAHLCLYTERHTTNAER